MQGGAIEDALRLPGERGGEEFFGETDRLFVDGRGPMLLPDGFHGSSRHQAASNPYTCAPGTEQGSRGIRPPQRSGLPFPEREFFDRGAIHERGTHETVSCWNRPSLRC